MKNRKPFIENHFKIFIAIALSFGLIAQLSSLQAAQRQEHYTNATSSLIDASLVKWLKLGGLDWMSTLKNGAGNLPKHPPFVHRALALTSSTMDPREMDSLALVDFYNMTQNGVGGWTNQWDLGNDAMDEWFGVRLDENGRVQSLVFLPEGGNIFNFSNNINGVWPESFGNLTELDTLIMGQAVLNTIPTSFGNLSQLQYVYLNNIRFDLGTSSIPPSIGNLNRLKFLRMEAMINLGGVFPSTISNLDSLTFLSITKSDMTGGIPADIGNLTALQTLRLAENTFMSGPIPDGIGNLSELIVFQTFENGLTGSIPDTIGNLNNLMTLHLYDNQLTGSLPVAIGSLSGLTDLRLYNNNLSGVLPNTFWQLTNLETLLLQDNSFTAALPESIANLTQLQDLDLSENNWSNTLPNGLWSLTNLASLSLDQNTFSGPISTSIGNLVNLEFLDLNDNTFSGPIPTELTNLTNLQRLQVQNNNLNGSLPAALGSLSNLTTFLAQNNQFTGCFPNSYTSFCAPTVSVNFSNNVGLPSSGDFTSFCMDGSGVCIENDECLTALPLPINIDTCGELYRLVNLADATTSGTGPFSDCNTTFASKDVWFSVVVPPTGNLHFRTTNPDFNLYAEVYKVCPISENDTIKCGSFQERKYGFVLDSLFNDPSINAGDPLLIRIWDSLNVASNQIGEILAFQVEQDTSTWSLCSLSGPIVGSRRLDSLALSEFYDNTGGPSWNITWDRAGTSMDEWYGIRLDENGRVQSFITRDQDGNVFNNNINGSIPESFGNLSQLDTLDIYRAVFNNLPASIGNLIELEYFAISNATFSNVTIPPTIGQLTQLETLLFNLGRNLTGPIPSEIGNLTNLKTLHLTFADFTGTIPPELGNLSNLVNLRITDNPNLTGSIPPQLGNLSALDELLLNSNSLSGSIPPELGNLTNARRFRLFGNQFTGSIPSSLGNLSSAIELYLNDNQLSGNIPSTLGNLSSLTLYMGLQDNNLSGAIPVELGNLANLTRMDLSANNLSDTIPKEIFSIPALRNLRLSQNNLTGKLPISLSAALTLEILELNENNLSGPLPNDFANLINLQEIQLQDNGFTGQLFDNVGNITNLILFNASNNQLSGCIPDSYNSICPISGNVNFSSNTGMPFNGNFDLFCLGQNGVCSENFACTEAIELPVNLEPCGRESRFVYLANATSSGNGPFGACDTAYQNSKDAWFKVMVPSTGNLLIRRDSATNINLMAEAYSACPPSASNVITCGNLSEDPFVMTLEGQTPGSEVFIRVWDSLDIAVNEFGEGFSEISAHQLGKDKTEWEVCDFIEFNNGTIPGTEKRKATEFIVQFENLTELEDLRTELNISPDSIMNCDCANKILQLWRTDNPIELEGRKRLANSGSGDQDTTDYNYVIEIATLLDTLGPEFVQGISSVGSANSAIALNEQGMHIITWSNADGEVFARMFGEYGDPIGEPFLVSNASANSSNPQISLNASEQFIITWADLIFNSMTSRFEKKVWYSSYDSNGSLIKKDSLDSGLAIDIAYYDDNSFLILSQLVDSLVFEIAKYDDDKAVMFKDTIFPGPYPRPVPSVSGLADNGNFLIAWFDQNSSDIQFRIYDSNGGFGSTVSYPIPDDAESIDVAMDANGNFVIVWTEDIGSSEFRIYASIFNSQGFELRGRIIVEPSIISSIGPISVDMDREGDFVVVWGGNEDRNDTNTYRPAVQYFNKQGDKIINEKYYTTGDDRMLVIDIPSVKINSNGNVVVSWANISPPSSNSYIVAQRLYSASSNDSLVNIRVDFDTIGIQKETWAPYSPQNPTGGVLIAVMDSGIKEDDPNVQNVLWNPSLIAPNCIGNQADDIGYDFVNDDRDPDDIDGHGHPVNSRIINGFDPNLQLELLNVKFFENGQTTLFDAVCGMYYAIEQGAKVINLSWGFESEELPSILQDVIDYAACKDVLVVTSAGNEGANNDLINKFPAKITTTNSNLITVGAYELDNQSNFSLAQYSNRGQEVDIVAPGFVEVLNPNEDPQVMGDEFLSLVGTSLSAPEVTRVAGILRAQYPHLTAEQTKGCLISSASPSIPGINSAGGVLNEAGALNCAEAAPNIGVSTNCLNETTIKVKVFLQGPMNGAEMRNDLALPLIDPYNGVVEVNTIPADVVDWVKIEIRDPTNPNQLLNGQYRIGFLRKDGQVVDRFGNEGLNFTDLQGLQGLIAVFHRNHLAVMTDRVENF